MNNEHGAAMLARVRTGDLVTVRLPDGRQNTGRAGVLSNLEGLREVFARIAPDAMPVAVTAGNIIRVQVRA